MPENPSAGHGGQPRRRWQPRVSLGGRLGLVVIAVGLLAIGLGWNGMAGAGGQINHVTDLRAQLPWLVSGGLLGLALVVLGSALVVAQSHRVDRARLEARLEELIGVVASRSTFTAVTEVPGDVAGLVAAGTASYHLSTCRLVEGRDEAEYLTPTEADARGLKPCRICKPAPATTEPAPAGRARR